MFLVTIAVKCIKRDEGLSDHLIIIPFLPLVFFALYTSCNSIYDRFLGSISKRRLLYVGLENDLTDGDNLIFCFLFYINILAIGEYAYL